MNIWQWIKRYVVMQDFLNKDLIEYSYCVVIFLFSNLVLTIFFIITNISPYAYDFNQLTKVDGTLEVNSYNYIHGKSSIVTPVVDISVSSDSIMIPYFRSKLDATDQLFQNKDNINHQKVQIWYLPQNNQFYLMNFLEDKALNNLYAAKFSKQELLEQVFFYKFTFPLALILAQFIIWGFQLYFIRLLIINNYESYKYADINNNDWKKKSVVFSRPILVGFLLFWPVIALSFITQLLISANYIV